VTSAAQRLFLHSGFAATTIAVIAAEARVSAETIYKAFGGKPGLVRAICEQALAGEGPVPAETRSDDLQTSEPDPRKIIQGWGRLSAEVAPRVSPILLLLRAAACTDPEMASLREEIEASRLARMTRNARTLADGGHLRAGITAEKAGEILWTYSSPELYELLVVNRRWPPEEYGTFIAEAMIAALLGEPRQLFAAGGLAGRVAAHPAALPGLRRATAVGQHDLAPADDEPRPALNGPAVIHRIARTGTHPCSVDGPALLRIPQCEISVGADGDRAFPGVEAEQAGSVG
jgi:AcrR family transcriptional regulator